MYIHKYWQHQQVETPAKWRLRKQRRRNHKLRATVLHQVLHIIKQHKKACIPKISGWFPEYLNSWNKTCCARAMYPLSNIEAYQRRTWIQQLCQSVDMMHARSFPNDYGRFIPEAMACLDDRRWFHLCVMINSIILSSPSFHEAKSQSTSTAVAMSTFPKDTTTQFHT